MHSTTSPTPSSVWAHMKKIGVRDFMDWRVPWYSALPSLDELLVGRTAGMVLALVSCLRNGDRVFKLG